MKVVFLSRYQNLNNRGTESFTRELTSRLSKKYTVDVLIGKDSDDLGKIMQGKYDLVVPLNGRLQSLRVSLGRIMGGYKVLISGHSGIGRDDIWNIAVTKPDVFVALTEYMASWAKKWAWGTKVIKIPNGVDINKFTPKGEKIKLNLPRPVILSVGELTWYKYHDRAIKAVAGLGQGSLLIAGSGEQYSELLKFGKESLGDRFKILSLPYDEMPKLYRSVDLFTLPSWDREAFGIVYLEAMASNIAVVAPNDPPRQEIIGDGGILVDVASSVDYIKGLSEALSRNWGDKPRKQAEKFSWDIVSERYNKIFRELIHE